MRSCFICLKIDVLRMMSSPFGDLEIIKDLHYFANISVIELKDAPVLLICKTCQKLSNICAEFKKKCIKADQNAKMNSSERFVWAENLTQLVMHQPVEETSTIETALPTEPENEIITEIEETPSEVTKSQTEIEETPSEVTKSQTEIEENLPEATNSHTEIEIDDPSLHIIERLSSQQIQELTEDISNLLKIDFHEDEQFSFIQTRSSMNRSNTKILEEGKASQFVCSKCALTFTDAQQLSLHFARIHIYKSKRNSL